MNLVSATFFVVSYIVAILCYVSAVGANLSFLFISLISALFVSLFMLVSHGKAWSALLVVALTTLVFPIAVLLFIGIYNQPPIWSQTKLMFSEMFSFKQTFVIRLVTPLIVGWLTTIAISKLAYKT